MLGGLKQHLKVCFMDEKRMPEFLKLQKNKDGERVFNPIPIAQVMSEYNNVQALRSSQKLFINKPSARLKDAMSESQMKELRSNSAVVKIDENRIKEKNEIKSKNKNNIPPKNEFKLMHSRSNSASIKSNLANDILKNSQTNSVKTNNINSNKFMSNNNIQIGSKANLKPISVGNSNRCGG